MHMLKSDKSFDMRDVETSEMNLSYDKLKSFVAILISKKQYVFLLEKENLATNKLRNKPSI